MKRLTSRLKVIFVVKSSNKKTGPMPQCYVHRNTCPTVCPLRNYHGCYGDSPRTNLVWRRLDRGEGITWNELCNKVSSLRELWRYGVIGDLPGKNYHINTRLMMQLCDANDYNQCMTYTHKWMQNHAINILKIKRINDRGITVNLSANTMHDVDDLVYLGLPITIMTKEYPKYYLCHETTIVQTPKLNRVMLCRHYTHGMQCIDCGLCSRVHRIPIGLPVHGTFRKRAAIVASNIV